MQKLQTTLLLNKLCLCFPLFGESLEISVQKTTHGRQITTPGPATGEMLCSLQKLHLVGTLWTSISLIVAKRAGCYLQKLRMGGQFSST